MQLHVLGSAAGGGVPQWNCGCSNCTAAREQRLPSRTQASLAASADGRSWVLFNATTDIRRQIERDPALVARGARESPICGVFLTDANIDHCAGLLEFRQAGSFAVHSTAVVRDTLCANAMFAPFAAPPRTWTLVDDGAVEIAGLRVSAVPVDGQLPSFAGSGRTDGAAVAYAIEDGAGVKAVYAPILLEIGAPLRQAADRADAAFFDGSFWSDDELIALGLGTRTARQMGHAPIAGAGGSLDTVRALACPRTFYTHANNSNPILDPSTQAAAELRAAGIALVEDGAVLTLEARVRRVNAGA